MGKQGPCCHCGITSTPLWRNGPPEKPVLCNACGSRWRTKGTLVNYTPLHTRMLTPSDFGSSKNYRENKLQHSTKSKSWFYNETKVEDGHSFATDHPYSTCFEDGTSNRSSSGSAVSVSESCVQYGSPEGNEVSGPFHSNFSDIQIPSKKRTRTRRQSPSPIEKFRQDLVYMLQQEGSSHLSEFSEEALLIEGEDLSFDSEIGHGSVLLKPPVSSKDEESEASSHVIQNKVFCLKETYMRSSSYSVQSQSSEISSHDIGKEGMIKDRWEINELKNNPERQCGSTNRSMEGTLSGYPDVLQSMYSAQIHTHKKPLINGSSISAKEVSSLTSDVTGSGISILANRFRDSPYFCTFEGKSSGTTGLKRPRVQSHVEMLTSGDISQCLNSDLNHCMNAVKVELP